MALDNGYAHNDLSWLPRLGARIAQIKRVAGMPDAIDAVVQHDKGTDLIVPAGVETGVVDVDDDGTLRKAVSIMRVDATTLRIRLDGSLGANDAKIRFDYNKWPSYNGTGKLVTDNWRTAGAKPAWAATIANLDAVELPLRRLDRPLVLGALAMSDPDR